jgi:hypothetical protein
MLVIICGHEGTGFSADHDARAITALVNVCPDPQLSGLAIWTYYDVRRDNGRRSPLLNRVHESVPMPPPTFASRCWSSPDNRYR